jgi:tRNA A37 N6-isopentenylltransferase MiaA
MSTRPPPRFVPTLTEVVHSGPAPLAAAPGFSHEQLAQRVLQRVDLMLDRRLREEIATVVLEQTSALVPLLRERLDSVVREIVAQAVADEMQARQRAGGGGV